MNFNGTECTAGETQKGIKHKHKGKIKLEHKYEVMQR